MRSYFANGTPDTANGAFLLETDRTLYARWSRSVCLPVDRLDAGAADGDEAAQVRSRAGAGEGAEDFVLLEPEDIALVVEQPGGSADDDRALSELSRELAKLRRDEIGFVFQLFNLIPSLSVAENIALPLYYQGVDDAESRRRVEKYADYVGLANRLSHRPNQLSGGQQQRVAIARALATDPVVILADEPTGNLDTAMSVEIMGLFTELNRQGKTIVMVTHEEDIAAYAGHRLVMRDGLIKEMA